MIAKILILFLGVLCVEALPGNVGQLTRRQAGPARAFLSHQKHQKHQKQCCSAVRALRLRGGVREVRRSDIPLVFKFFVYLCGTAWAYGCFEGLLVVFNVARQPGGLGFLEERSSHGLLGVMAFVAFSFTLFVMQIMKLYYVLMAASLSSIRRTLLFQSLFDALFVYLCTRSKPSYFHLSWRDSIIALEAVTMFWLLVSNWLQRPWRGAGHRLHERKEEDGKSATR